MSLTIARTFEAVGTAAVAGYLARTSPQYTYTFDVASCICKERPLHSLLGRAGPKHDSNQFFSGVG